MSNSVRRCASLRCEAGQELVIKLEQVNLSGSIECKANLFLIDGPGAAILGDVDFETQTATFTATEPGCYVVRVTCCCPRS